MIAPVTVIIAYDLLFLELPGSSHNPAMRDLFAENPQLVDVASATPRSRAPT